MPARRSTVTAPSVTVATARTISSWAECMVRSWPVSRARGKYRASRSIAVTLQRPGPVAVLLQARPGPVAWYCKHVPVRLQWYCKARPGCGCSGTARPARVRLQWYCKARRGLVAVILQRGPGRLSALGGAGLGERPAAAFEVVVGHVRAVAMLVDALHDGGAPAFARVKCASRSSTKIHGT